MDYVYKKAGPIFNAHSYWTKQPVDVIKIFLDKYTQIGDVVLDPFCGSGMTGVACIQTNRKYLISDISPVCAHISKGYCNKFIKDNYQSTMNSLIDSISYLYKSKCPICGNEFNIDYTIVQDELESNKNLILKEIVGKCKHCNKKIRKFPDSNDKTLFLNDDFKNHFYPTEHFFGNEPKRNYKRGIFQVYQLYTNRNLSALSILLNGINNIHDITVRQQFLFAFSSILFNCSILSRYNPKYENTQIKMGTFYIPKLIKENNVIESFKRKVCSIIKASDEIYKQAYTHEGKVMVADATNLNHIADNSIDYIYTDPPYSDKISYSELNVVYESWVCNNTTDVSKEMIVSKASNKSIEFYSTLFNSFMLESKRILREGKYITIIFHNSSLLHWKYFQDIISIDGLKPILTTEPERLISSSKTSTQYQTTNDSQCFLAFTFQKDSTYKTNSPQELSNDEYSNLVATIRNEAIDLGYKQRCDQFDFIINRLLFKYKINNKIPL